MPALQLDLLALARAFVRPDAPDRYGREGRRHLVLLTLEPGHDAGRELAREDVRRRIPAQHDLALGIVRGGLRAERDARDVGLRVRRQ